LTKLINITISQNVGWQDKLWWVRGNDEGGNWLEESLQTVFQRTVY
jgi:hypothetical protein